jgi:hypothetical protein
LRTAIFELGIIPESITVGFEAVLLSTASIGVKVELDVRDGISSRALSSTTRSWGCSIRRSDNPLKLAELRRAMTKETMTVTISKAAAAVLREIASAHHVTDREYIEALLHYGA